MDRPIVHATYYCTGPISVIPTGSKFIVDYAMPTAVRGRWTFLLRVIDDDIEPYLVDCTVHLTTFNKNAELIYDDV